MGPGEERAKHNAASKLEKLALRADRSRRLCNVSAVFTISLCCLLLAVHGSRGFELRAFARNAEF